MCRPSKSTSRSAWPAGFADLILITSRGKDALVDYFDRGAELEELLERKAAGRPGDDSAADRVWRTSRPFAKRGARLGHACCARAAWCGRALRRLCWVTTCSEGDEPASKQLLDVYAKYGKGVWVCGKCLLARNTFMESAGEPLDGGVFRLIDWSRSPSRQAAFASRHLGPLYLAAWQSFPFLPAQARQGRRDSTDRCPWPLCAPATACTACCCVVSVSMLAIGRHVLAFAMRSADRTSARRCA